MFKTQNEAWLFLKSKEFITKHTIIAVRRGDNDLKLTAGYLQTKPFETLQLSDFANERKDDIYIGRSHVSLKFIAKILNADDNAVDVLRKAETDVNDYRDWIELWRRTLIRNHCDIRIFNLIIPEQRGGIYNHAQRSLDRQWSRFLFQNTFDLKYAVWPTVSYKEPNNLIVYIDHIPLSVIWAAIDLKNDAILAKIRAIQSANEKEFATINSFTAEYINQCLIEREAEKDKYNNSCRIS